MSEPIGSGSDELVRSTAAITAAIQRAAREAVLEHARAGRSVPTWRDGRVVWIEPAEILARYAGDASNPAPDPSPSSSSPS